MTTADARLRDIIDNGTTPPLATKPLAELIRATTDTDQEQELFRRVALRVGYDRAQRMWRFALKAETS